MKGVRPPRAARPRATRVARGSFGGQEVVAAGFVLAMVAVAAVAAWPIYASPAYLVTVGTATLGGTAIAVLAHWRGWRAGAVVAAVAGLLVVIGLTVAVPIWSVGPARAIAGFGTGLVTAWKDLVTVDLPVGGYRNLLVPALVVFAVGTLAALLLAWRHSRVHVLAVPVLLAAQWFGLGFGADAATAPVTVLGVPVAAPREAVLGALGLVLGLGMLAWRARQERAAALGRAADATGVRLVRRPTGAGARSLALALGMVTIAVGAGVVLTPLVAAGSTREVLRSATGPDLRLAAEVSPLAGYRAWFTDAS
ncbi:MAG TPA: transglutaminase, partial [Actinotalea sp.]|nr:transglutaminase [Actinotalea sp.]